VNMIIYNFQSMDFVAFLCANIVEYRLAILFRNDENIISIFLLPILSLIVVLLQK